MQLTDLRNYDMVILYGMGFNGKSVLNRIRGFVPNIICWDRNQDEYDGYQVTPPPVDCSFLASCGKYLIIVTPTIPEYTAEMVDSIPDGCNVATLYSFEEFKDGVHTNCDVLFVTEKGNRLFPITSDMLVQSDEKIYGYDKIGCYSTSLRLCFPYVVIDKQGKFFGIASITDIQKYILAHEDSYKIATFGDVANRKAEAYFPQNLPIDTKYECAVVNNNYNEPIMFYLGANRFISEVIIDIIDACNLRCPTCPRGSHEIPNSSEKMSLGDFENIIQTFSQQYGIKSFTLYNWMEPFLVNDLHKYFDVLEEYSCKGTLSSNLSLKNNDVIERVITHNALDSIMISVSGFSNDVHGIYHRGSDINIVKANLAFISELRLRRPLESFVYVKFLKFDYNESDALLFKEYAKKLGLAFYVFNAWGDSASFKYPSAPRTLADRLGNSLSAKPVDINHCCSLFNQIAINAKCDIFACCREPTVDKLMIGNFYTDTIEDIFVKKFFYPGCRSCTIPKITPMNSNVRKIITNAIKL